jgi:hypothetical protein
MNQRINNGLQGADGFKHMNPTNLIENKVISRTEVNLISAICRIGTKNSISKETIDKIKEVHNDHGYKFEFIQKMIENHKQENIFEDDKETEELDTQNSYGEPRAFCFKCGDPVRSKYPIDITCPSHKLCLNCRVKSYSETYASVCPECNREYRDDELSLISSYKQT